MFRRGDKNNGERIIKWEIQFWHSGEKENFLTIIITIFLPIKVTPDRSRVIVSMAMSVRRAVV